MNLYKHRCALFLVIEWLRDCDGFSCMYLKLLEDLVSFETVTPEGSDAINYCATFLEKLGFKCWQLKFGNVSNLYAKYGHFEKNICFAGHVDVVPPMEGWNTKPFILTNRDGKLYGRGTNDMKGPLSSALSAIVKFLNTNRQNFSISVLLDFNKSKTKLFEILLFISSNTFVK